MPFSLRFTNSGPGHLGAGGLSKDGPGPAAGTLQPTFAGLPIRQSGECTAVPKCNFETRRVRYSNWIEVNKLRRAYKDGGVDALVKASADLYRKDLDQFNRVACAFDPGHMRRIRDAVENAGYTFQGLSELAKKKQY